MSTFVQVRSKVADYLNRTDLTTQINTAINRAIEFYEKERFWFNETSGTFSTTSGNKSYSTSIIPSDISEIDYIEIVVSGQDYKIERRTFDEIEEIDVNHATGIPSIWSFYQNQIYLYPIPNGTYTVRVFYKKTYAVLSADADTNDWTTEAEDLIESHACWRIYSYVLHQDDKASKFKNIELEALNSLQAKTVNLVIGVTSIRPTSF